MLLRRLAISLLIPLCTVLAQAPLPALRIEPADGGSVLYIRNVAGQSLTGFLIELLNYPGSYYAFWQDDVTAEPLAVGAEQKTRIGNMTVGAVPDYVKVQAAIYSDGSSSGVAEKVALLQGRRRFALETMRQLIQRLEKAQAESKGKDLVLADLRQWMESMEQAGKAKRYAQEDISHAASREVIGNAISSLSDHSVGEVLIGSREHERRA